MQKIKLYLRETHLYQDGDKIFPVKYAFFEVNEGDKFTLYVTGDVVYTNILCNQSERILAPVKETPKELCGCPYFELVDIPQKEG